MREMLILVATGIALGLPATLLATRWIATKLYGISPMDPLTVASATAIMLWVTMLAGYLPARRATRIDPMIALRFE